MEITKDFLLSEIKRLEAERNQASSFVTASQGAIDAYTALVERLDAKETKGESLWQCNMTYCRTTIQYQV
jgi:hypothetical protein